MNDRQLQLFIRQAFALAKHEAAIVGKADPQLLAVMRNVRSLVERMLPDDGLLREQMWRDLKPLVMAELAPYGEAVRRAMGEELAGLAPEAQEVGLAMLEEAVPSPLPVAGPAPGAPIGLRAPVLQDSVAAALNSRVGTTRVLDLFVGSERTGVSTFVARHGALVDRAVRAGILQGKPTREIAADIVTLIERNGMEVATTGGQTVARAMRGEVQALARTAVQDANRQVAEAVYAANEDKLKGLDWEWVAALDSRTCPTCAPLDGTRKDKRSDLPSWPVHINCRCRVVPVDPDENLDVRTGMKVSEDKLAGDRAYKTKIKVKGEKMYRKAEYIKRGKDGKQPSYADYLAQMGPKEGTTATETQRMFFGGGNAGNARGTRFNQLVQSGMSPEKALERLVTGDPLKRGFVPVDKLPAVPKGKPPSKPPSKPKPPSTPPTPPARPPASKPKPKPPAAPPTPPPPKPEPPAPAAPAAAYPVKGLTMTSPKTAKWAAKNGDPGELIDEALGAMEAEGGLAGQHAQRLRQFAREKKVMAHFPMMGERDAPALHYDDHLDDLIDSQRGLVERMRKYKPTGSDDAFMHKIRLRAAEGVLSDLEERKGPGLKRGMQTLIENISAGGYTRPTTGVVNVNLTPDSGRPGAKGVANLRLRAKENLQATLEAVKKNMPEAMPFSGFSGADDKEHWLGVYIHEMGHQVHYQGLNGRHYAGKKKDGLQFVSDYGSTDPDEQFAEAFVQYVLNPEGLKQHAPGLYGWVDEAMTNALKP